MLHRALDNKRQGATSVEAAFVLPVAFFLVLAIVIGGMGIFKYQEMAHIARETARFASVHGAQYAKQNAAAIQAGTLPNVDKTYLINYAKGLAVALDASQLNVTVNMVVIAPGSTSANSTETVDWDNTTESQNRSPYSAWTNTATTPASNVQVDNVVIVQVSYAWYPGLIAGPITLSSTAVMGMSY
jgi:Flp pilus assembly protein TadG